MDLFTIGHTIQSQDEFLQMLHAFNIDCIIDVRSIPYSQHASQFNQDSIKRFLQYNGIHYAHFGLEFGARRNDCLKETLLKDGSIVQQVNFELGTTTDYFKLGVNRLDKALSQGRIVSLMCTESNPLDCHRFSFISRYLNDNGYKIGHIVRNKDTRDIVCKTHYELEKEMIDSYLHKKKTRTQTNRGATTEFRWFSFPEFYRLLHKRRTKN